MRQNKPKNGNRGRKGAKMRNANKLKDCPFCGSRPYFEYKGSILGFNDCAIGCKKCRVRMIISTVLEKDLDIKAIKKWNERKGE